MNEGSGDGDGTKTLPGLENGDGEWMTIELEDELSASLGAFLARCGGSGWGMGCAVQVWLSHSRYSYCGCM